MTYSGLLGSVKMAAEILLGDKSYLTDLTEQKQFHLTQWNQRVTSDDVRFSPDKKMVKNLLGRLQK